MGQWSQIWQHCTRLLFLWCEEVFGVAVMGSLSSSMYSFVYYTNLAFCKGGPLFIIPTVQNAKYCFTKFSALHKISLEQLLQYHYLIQMEKSLWQKSASLHVRCDIQTSFTCYISVEHLRLLKLLISLSLCFQAYIQVLVDQVVSSSSQILLFWMLPTWELCYGHECFHDVSHWTICKNSTVQQMWIYQFSSTTQQTWCSWVHSTWLLKLLPISNRQSLTTNLFSHWPFKIMHFLCHIVYYSYWKYYTVFPVINNFLQLLY